MDFEYSERVSHPLEAVYPVLRDHLDKLVPLLPNVESIVVSSREVESPGRTRIVNLWQGTTETVPRLARPFVKPEMNRWEDHALWLDDEHAVEWRFVTSSFDRLYDCSGVNRFAADGDGSRVLVSGTLDVYPERLRGVPKALARRARPKVEAWLIKMITPNLAELPKAIQTYLDQ